MPHRTFVEIPTEEQHAEMLATLRRALVDLLKVPSREYGWCRTRWSYASLALTWQATRGITVSSETMRRWVRAGPLAPMLGR